MKSEIKKQQRKLNREIHKFYRYLHDNEPQWYGRFKVRCLSRQWYPYPRRHGELWVMLELTDSLTHLKRVRTNNVDSWVSYCPDCLWRLLNDFIIECRLKQVEMGYPDD